MEKLLEVYKPSLSGGAFLGRMTAGVLLLNLFVLALVGLSLYQSRQLHEEQAAVETQNLAKLLEQHVDVTIDKTDIVLFAAVEEFEHQFARGAVNRGEMGEFLGRMVSRLPELDSLTVTDAQGLVIFHTDNGTVTTADLSDRDFFLHLRENPKTGLYISKPIKSRSSGRWMVMLTRRINLADGAFAGTVGGALPLDYFLKIFSSINVGPHGVIALRDGDLKVIDRFPSAQNSDTTIGQKKTSPELNELIRQGKTSETYKATPPIDNIERIYTFRKLPAYPLYTFVGLAGSDYLREWRSEVEKMAAAAALFLLVTLLSARLIHQGWRSRNDMFGTLAEQEIKYRTVADYTYDWEYWLAPDGSFLYISPSCGRITGYSAAQFYEDPELFHRILHQDDRTLYAAHLSQDWDRAGSLIFRIVHADGEIRWLEHACQPIFDDSGKFLGSRCCNRDVTSRQATEEELLLTKLCMDTAAIGIYNVSADGSILSVNDYASRNLGYSKEELTVMNIRDVDPVVNEGKAWEITKSLREYGYVTHESVHRRKDGSLFPVEITTNVVEFRGKIYPFSFVKDITERKLTEQSLQETQFSVDHASIPIFWLQGEGRLSYANCACDYLGYSREELLGMSIFDIDPDLSGIQAAGLFEKLGETRSVVLERRHRTKNGALIPVEVTIHGVRISGKEFHVTYVRDISERKSTEAQIARSEQRFRAIFESAHDAIFLIAGDSGYLDCNPAATEMFRCAKEDLLTRNPQYFSPPAQPDGQSTEQKAADLIAAALTRDPQSFEWRHRRPDGSEFDAMVVLSRVELDHEPTLLAIVRDISQRKNLENQLYHIQKMESIGTLAGGVAHDFNNLLTVITGYGCMIKTKTEPADPRMGMIEQILASADRAAQLTRGLLAFSRKQTIEPKPVELNDIVNRVDKLLRRLIGEDIKFITKLSEIPLRILADAGQIEQVLMNLATNARDAMAEGGTLIISTEEKREEHYSFHGLIKPGKYALIEVSDTGTGMDEKMRTKIFEPFFTTKEVGRGTGLGLAIVYGIIKQHNGFINVYSEPGRGTTFKIHLPLIAEMITDSSAEAGPPPKGGSETILLVEDDHVVRTMTGNYLRDFGYRVIEAVDGEEALEKFAAHEKEIQLLILDIVMPKKNGREVYNGVQARRPGTAVLFVSGYAADSMQEKGNFTEEIQFLAKPASPFELLRKIRELLDGKI